MAAGRWLSLLREVQAQWGRWQKEKKHCRWGTGSDKGLFVTCRGEAREDAAAGHCLVLSRAALVQKRGLKACLFAHTGES